MLNEDNGWIKLIITLESVFIEWLNLRVGRWWTLIKIKIIIFMINNLCLSYYLRF